MSDAPDPKRPESEPSRPFKAWKRPVLPHERTVDASKNRGGAFVTAGLEFGAVVGLATWLGRYLDGRFGWDPWGTAILAMLGVTGAFVLLLRRIQRMEALNAQDKARSEKTKEAEETARD